MANMRELMEHYARGGQAHPMQEAQRLQRYGQGGDNILAHINPEEASMLAQSQGMDINPHTGLPQFGFFKKAVKFLKKAAPVIGGVAGGYALGNAMPWSSAPSVGGPGFMGGMFGGGNVAAQRAGAMNSLRGVGMSPTTIGGGASPGFLSSLNSNGGLSNMLLGGGMLASAMGRHKTPKNEATETLQAHNSVDRSRLAQPKPLNRRYIQSQPYTFDNNAESEFFEDANPPLEFKEGGYVDGGYVDDETGGVDDKHKTEISPDSYVWDATSVSLLGDGNSHNGKLKLSEFEESLPKSGFIKQEHRPRLIPAYLSGGEKVTGPAALKAAGGGSAKKGAEKFDKIRKNLRKQKGLSTKTLLPKAKKKVGDYFRG